MLAPNNTLQNGRYRIIRHLGGQRMGTDGLSADFGSGLTDGWSADMVAD